MTSQPLKGFMEEVFEVKPNNLREMECEFIGGSLDGSKHVGTIADNVIVTLKNQEQYKFEKPNIMRFIGMKPKPLPIPFEANSFRVSLPMEKIYVGELKRLGVVRYSSRLFGTATEALAYAKRWAERANKWVGAS